MKKYIVRYTDKILGRQRIMIKHLEHINFDRFSDDDLELVSLNPIEVTEEPNLNAISTLSAKGNHLNVRYQDYRCGDQQVNLPILEVFKHLLTFKTTADNKSYEKAVLELYVKKPCATLVNIKGGGILFIKLEINFQDVLLIPIQLNYTEKDLVVSASGYKLGKPYLLVERETFEDLRRRFTADVLEKILEPAPFVPNEGRVIFTLDQGVIVVDEKDGISVSDEIEPKPLDPNTKIQLPKKTST